MSGSFAIPEIVLRELPAGAWEIRPGGKHGKLYVKGVFCGVVSRGRSRDEERGALNLRAQVRRVLAK